MQNMTVEISQQDSTQLLELFVLYSKKNAFSIDEYGDVFTMYNKVREFLMKLQSAPDATAKLTVEQKELAYLVKVMDICSQRTPVEVQNYKAISSLYERLNGLVIKDELPELEKIEEVKEEE